MRRPKEAGDCGLPGDLAVLPRRRIGFLLRHEPPVHINDPAIAGLERRHDEMAEAAIAPAWLGQGLNDADLVIVVEMSGDDDRLVFLFGDIELRPVAWTRSGNRRGVDARRDPRDQRLLPGE